MVGASPVIGSLLMSTGALPPNRGRKEADMKVRDLMSYPIATVPPDATVLEAMRKMGEEGKGSLLVARSGLLKECLGIVTTSRIFHNVFAEGRDPGQVTVSEIMTPAPLVTIDLNASTEEAAKLMQKHNIRRLPVMKDGALVGIVTSKDLLACVK
ncbi:MAG TPA: CBS domain-containing protein [Methanothrix sp.]|nr:CBS domain-containing protein [Methanothrix sp.]